MYIDMVWYTYTYIHNGVIFSHKKEWTLPQVFIDPDRLSPHNLCSSHTSLVQRDKLQPQQLPPISHFSVIWGKMPPEGTEQQVTWPEKLERKCPNKGQLQANGFDQLYLPSGEQSWLLTRSELRTNGQLRPTPAGDDLRLLVKCSWQSEFPGFREDAGFRRGRRWKSTASPHHSNDYAQHSERQTQLSTNSSSEKLAAIVFFPWWGAMGLSLESGRPESEFPPSWHGLIQGTELFISMPLTVSGTQQKLINICWTELFMSFLSFFLKKPPT